MRLEKHLDSLKYKHILKHVIVPSVRVLCPDGVIQFHKTIPLFMILVWL